MIKVSNLKYIYNNGLPDEKIALENINFEIKDGEFVAIIGHTGSGKSTLIQHLNGLIKPTEGKILIDDINICQKGVDLKEIRKKVGLVFQYPEHQLFEETVARDVAFGPKKLGLLDDEVNKRVVDAIKLVELDESILDKSPFDLSGGQKRRVAIAGVLSMQPKILILDEPTAGLDPKGRDNLLAFLKKLNKEYCMTIILVSHSMEDVAKVADRIIVMNSGTIFLDDKVSTVFSMGKELQKIGLNVPQITILIDKLNEMGADLPKDIYTVDYCVSVLKERMKGKNDV